MTYEAILLDRKDRVATITLDRPERLNAWTPRMAFELSDALRACNEDDDVRAVVLTGAGRAFCAGADLGAGAETFGGFVEGRREGRGDPPPELFPWQIAMPPKLHYHRQLNK